jgi:hypothetical protein
MAKNNSGRKLLARLTKGAKKPGPFGGKGPQPKRGDAAYWRRVARQYQGAADWLTLLGVGQRSASATGPNLAMPNATRLRAKLVVMSSSGPTGTLSVRVETSNDGTTWATAGTFPLQTGGQASTPDELIMPVSLGAGGLVRAVYTVGGTGGAFTFGVGVVKDA